MSCLSACFGAQAFWSDKCNVWINETLLYMVSRWFPHEMCELRNTWIIKDRINICQEYFISIFHNYSLNLNMFCKKMTDFGIVSEMYDVLTHIT